MQLHKELSPRTREIYSYFVFLPSANNHTNRPVAIVNILTYGTVYGKERNNFWCCDILQLIFFIIKNYDYINFYKRTNVTNVLVDPAASVILSAFCVESAGWTNVSTNTEQTPTGEEKA